MKNEIIAVSDINYMPASLIGLGDISIVTILIYIDCMHMIYNVSSQNADIFVHPMSILLLKCPGICQQEVQQQLYSHLSLKLVL